jgi:hypothetical protein
VTKNGVVSMIHSGVSKSEGSDENSQKVFKTVDLWDKILKKLTKFVETSEQHVN